MVVHPLPRALVAASIAGAVLVIVAVVMQLGAERFDMTWMIAPFLLGFGCFKGALAIDAQQTLRGGGEAAERLVAQHGSPANVRQWVLYKFAAMVMGLGGGGIALAMAIA